MDVISCLLLLTGLRRRSLVLTVRCGLDTGIPSMWGERWEQAVVTAAGAGDSAILTWEGLTRESQREEVEDESLPALGRT